MGLHHGLIIELRLVYLASDRFLALEEHFCGPVLLVSVVLFFNVSIVDLSIDFIVRVIGFVGLASLLDGGDELSSGYGPS